MVRQSVAETLLTIIDPLVYDEAVHLIEQHREEGRDIIIVSASGAEVAEPIGAMLGADHVIATKLSEEGGRYTGEIEFYNYGPTKAESIQTLALRRGYLLADCHGYSDSSTDLPMLEAVGHPVAVNPDGALERHAVVNGWPVVHFSQRTKAVIRRAAAGAAATAIGAAGFAGGMRYAARS